MVKKSLVLATALMSADLLAAGVGGTGTNPNAAQSRTVSGSITLAEVNGATGSSANGGPLCSQLMVSFYLQTVGARQGRYLGTSQPTDELGACTYTFTNTQPKARTGRPRRWFAVVSERGPLSYDTVCYQHGYADLGLFAANTTVVRNIDLDESCPVGSDGPDEPDDSDDF